MIQKILVGILITSVLTLFPSCSSDYSEELAEVELCDIDWCRCMSANYVIDNYNHLFPNEAITQEDIIGNYENEATIRVTEDIFYNVKEKAYAMEYSIGGFKEFDPVNRDEFFDYVERLSQCSTYFHFTEDLWYIDSDRKPYRNYESLGNPAHVKMETSSQIEEYSENETPEIKDGMYYTMELTVSGKGLTIRYMDPTKR